LSVKVDAKNGISNSPYTTQIIGIGGELVNSSTAYEGVFVYNPGFANPSDIFITKDDIVYVADSGNGRVFVYNHETGETGEIGKDVLMQPTGVWVTDEGYVYVADQKRKELIAQQIVAAKNTLRNLQSTWEYMTPEERQTVCRELIEKVVIYKNGNVDLRLHLNSYLAANK
jgi:DNA-binding beta-propeller fold protein YncE